MVAGFGSIFTGWALQTKIGIAGVLFLVLWLTGYFIGLLPWLGYRSASESNFGIGKLTALGNNKTAFSLGLNTMPLLKGQEFFVNYDTRIKSGELFIELYRPSFFKSGHRTRISISGKGQFVTPITVSGLYKLRMRGRVDNKGKGWDLSYSASWGARWQKAK